MAHYPDGSNYQKMGTLKKEKRHGQQQQFGFGIKKKAQDQNIPHINIPTTRLKQDGAMLLFKPKSLLFKFKSTN